MSRSGESGMIDEMTGAISDQQARDMALSPDRSFIVQAPAGSGKTSLLVQRVLRLLACVERPEQILAITFTRKAAGEMHNRVIDALSRAAGDEPPDNDYDKRFWELAREVRQRDEQLGWQLLHSPARLKIQTIDAFNASLVHRLPLLSETGTPPQASDDADELYEEAAWRTIELIAEPGEAGDYLALLLQHLDGRTEFAADLLIDMLRRRDHWLRQLVGRHSNENLREHVESGMKRLVESEIGTTLELIPDELLNDLMDLAGIAAQRVVDAKPGSHISLCENIDIEKLGDDAGVWRGLGELLLTSNDQWRKTVTKNTGFPTDDKESKNRMLDLLDRMSAVSDLLKRVGLMRRLPDIRYTDAQWSVVESLLYILPRAAAQLTLVFREHGVSDHIEIAQAALRALRSDDAPTDLALALDYRIHHVLVDEFQDTSISQLELLEALTEGWQPGDGNSLFCVGDPMQSIYRFREAQVSIFLRAWQHGIGSVLLTPLKLSQNFRSQSAIVDWVNHSFAMILPGQNDLSRGAVSYAGSVAQHPALDGDAVCIHSSFADNKRQEAETMLRLIEQSEDDEHNKTTAILVRSRNHLIELVSLLKEKGKQFLAVELEYLGRRPMIQDLIALTRALLHDGDRSAWLALLRAPWCGLTADDLHIIASGTPSRPASGFIPDLIADDQLAEHLSDDGRRRLVEFREVIQAVRLGKHRAGLHRWIESAWLALGGPATVQRESELQDAEAFFDLLQSLERAGDLEDITSLEAHVNRLFASVDPNAGSDLQLMTIHKAKGLQFDTVIIPGLGRSTSRNSSRLLHWLEVTRGDDGVDLLLAPIGKTGAEHDPMHRYLSDVENERDALEQARLMYVGATRAVRRLHLLGHVTTQEQNGEISSGRPRKGSLLSQLWPAMRDDFENAFAAAAPISSIVDEDKPETDMRIRRLVSGWKMPILPGPVVDVVPGVAVERDPGAGIRFDRAGELTRLAGSIVHKELECIANQGLDQWTRERIASRRGLYRKKLRRIGTPEAECGQAVEGICHALVQTLDDQRGRWILSGDHQDAACELELSTLQSCQTHTYIIDRTFVDDNGTRWIIDYKVGSDEDGAAESFLDEEQRRYTGQLEKYGELMMRMEDRETMLALYFPMVGGWRCWSAGGGK